MKQIGFALHNYHAAHGALPPAYTVDADGRPLHSWRTLLLPYLGHTALYDSIDLDKPWDDPANRAAFETDVAYYRCPSASALKGQATYVVVVAPDGCFRGPDATSLSDITDDTNQTLLVVEVDAANAVDWMSPHDANEALLLAATQSQRPPHVGITYATLADGSERALRSDLPAATWRALISIAGGDSEAVQAD